MLLNNRAAKQVDFYSTIRAFGRGITQCVYLIAKPVHHQYFHMQNKLFFLTFSCLLFCVTVAHSQAQQSNWTTQEAQLQTTFIVNEAMRNTQKRERAWREAVSKQELYTNDLSQRLRQRDAPKEDIQRMKLTLARATTDTKIAEGNMKNAKLWEKETQKTVNMSHRQRVKWLRKYGFRPMRPIANEAPYMSQTKQKSIEARTLYGRSTTEQDFTARPLSTEEKEAAYATYDPIKDTALNPPDYKCKLAFSGKDQFSNRQRLDLQPENLFFYTDERLSPYFQERDYLTASVYLSRLEGGYHFLTLIVNILSQNAPLEYGRVDQGSILSIKTLSKKTIKLQASKTATAQYDKQKNSFTYRLQYTISGSAKKILEDELVDRVRLTWSTGYEDYDIYEIDLLQRQFECLKSASK